MARIRAILRRTGKGVASIAEIEAGGAKLNVKTRNAWNHGVPLDLTSLEFDLLELLVSVAGRTRVPR